jgi:hypothetical protein
MRKQHPAFEPLGDPETPIWRYFDFPKFLSMLKERSLYFCRADLLGDPLEGSYTRARQAQRERMLANPPAGYTREELETIFAEHGEVYASFRRFTYVNCWHQGDHESMAMWQGYGSGPYGLAIRSTVNLLERLLPQEIGGERFAKIFGGESAAPILICRVKYIDYTSELEGVPNEDFAYAAFTCKSLAYRHEAELRALFNDMPLREHGQQDRPPGRLVPIDLQSLIRQVTVSPLAPGWFESLVNSACEAFGLRFTVGRSSVFTTPIY